MFMLCEISHLGTGSGIPRYQDSQGFPRTTTWRICPPIDLGICLSWCLACWRSWWLMCSALHLAPDGVIIVIGWRCVRHVGVWGRGNLMGLS
jgi:hypothetical protein